MKKIIIFLLSCIIIGNVLSDRKTRIKKNHAMKTMKNLVENKEKQRKLEELEDTELPEESTDEEKGSETNSTSFPVDPDEPVANVTKETNNTDSTIQIKKFHNYRRESQQFLYNVFFYFLNRPIVEIVVIRIRFIYSRALRGLQEDNDIEAESVPSTCTIKDEYKEKVGETSENGENVDYDCTAPTSSVADIKNATVDTDYPLDLGNGTTVNFTDINFDEDAAEEAVNLIEIKNYTKAGALDGSTVEFLRNSFRINGTATPENLFINPEKTSIKMQFINYKNEEEYGIKNVTCSIKEISSSSNKYSLDCGSSLKSYISNITVAKSLDNDTFLKININQEETDELQSTGGGSRSILRRNSNKLSGGAIAGLILACVVALIAVTILAIMVRRKSKASSSFESTVANLRVNEYQ